MSELLEKIKGSLEERILLLFERQQELCRRMHNLKISGTIEFSISDILEEEPSDNRTGVKQLVDKLRVIKKDAVVYFFQIVNEKDISNVLDVFEGKRPIIEKAIARKRIYEKEKKSSDILYVGSKIKDIHLRFKQHMGWGPKNTYALQLKEWAKNYKEWKFLFYYIIIENIGDDKYILRDIEAAISNRLEPILGKDEKF